MEEFIRGLDTEFHTAPQQIHTIIKALDVIVEINFSRANIDYIHDSVYNSLVDTVEDLTNEEIALSVTLATIFALEDNIPPSMNNIYHGASLIAWSTRNKSLFDKLLRATED